jgi:hypothetical protein
MSDWKPEAGKPALVIVENLSSPSNMVRVSAGDGKCAWIDRACLLEPPPAITPQQLAVIKAAKVRLRARGVYDISVADEGLDNATRDLIASEAPPDPKEELLAAAKAHLSEDSHKTHERLLNAIRAMEADDGK